jgi:uncharacterized protein (DUF3820 family)
MLDQAQRTSKAIDNILVLYKISTCTRPIKKYDGRKLIIKECFLLWPD